MLIFDRFFSRDDAQRFAQAVEEKYSIQTWIFDSQEAATGRGEGQDVFPFQLDSPIVHVSRDHDYDEEAIEALVVAYGGTFAGT